MNRLSVVAAKRAFLGAIALLALAAPRVAMAQEPDPLKFTTNAPRIVGWVIKAEKTTEFEEAWAGIRALLAKSDNAELKAFGSTLENLYKIDQPAFEYPQAGSGQKAVIYIFRIDAPSTTYSYNPRQILYEYLKAGQEGSPVTRAEADTLYTTKLGSAFLTVNPLWTLTKIGG